MQKLCSMIGMTKNWKNPHGRIQVLCAPERINGAAKAGGVWGLPANAKKPSDSGKKNRCSMKGAV